MDTGDGAPSDQSDAGAPKVHNVMSGSTHTVLQFGAVHGPVTLNQQPRTRVVPRQLPAAITGFTDRVDQVTALDTLLAGARTSGSTAMVIATLSGTAGVGKTALAVHWARGVSTDFPDGQLYADLRGYGPHNPVSAADVLDQFLRALGVPADEVAADQAGRSAQFRTLLDQLRVLVLLDNVADVEHVRPLLPGCPSCFVIITSRDTLSGLVARDGAQRIGLQPLPEPEAIRLLTAIAGDRVGADRSAAAELVRLCARLPLAIRIAAELAASRPESSLEELVVELGDEQRRLDLLEAGDDPQTAVRSVFSWSLRNLPEPAAQLFRLIGVHPGPHLSVEAIAALVPDPVSTSRRRIDLLRRANLLEHAGPGRIRMHDLLRIYAAELAAELSGAEQADTVRRLFDHYLAGADTGSAAWLEQERVNLVAMVVAHGARSPEHVLGLSTAAAPFLRRNGYLTDARTLHTQGAAAARNQGLASAEAVELDHLGVVHRRLGNFDSAVREHSAALDIARRVADDHLEATALDHLGVVHMRTGDYQEALSWHQRALAIHVTTGERAAEGRARNNIGIVHRRRGEFGEAVRHHQQAVDIAVEVGNRADEANASTSLGIANRRAGLFGTALRHHRHALELHRTLGNNVGVASALTRIAMVHERLHQPVEALDHFEQAMQVHRRTGNRTGEGKSLTNIGIALRKLGRRAEGLDHLRHAIEVLNTTGSRADQAHALNAIGTLHQENGHLSDALDSFAAALRIHESMSNDVDAAHVHNNSAAALRSAGDHRAAAEHHQKALSTAERTGNAELHHETRRGLGELAMAEGNADNAVEHFADALARATDLDNPLMTAEAHTWLAEALLIGSKHDEAHEHWRRALAGYDDLGLSEADDVRRRMRESEPTDPG